MRQLGCRCGKKQDNESKPGKAKTECGRARATDQLVDGWPQQPDRGKQRNQGPGGVVQRAGRKAVHGLREPTHVMLKDKTINERLAMFRQLPDVPGR